MPDDKLALTLDTLRSDVERTPVADSQTVRRRGDRRTRNQAVGGALVVVALVAGVAGLYGGAGGDSRRTAPPATQTPQPTETPLALAADPFLTGSELTGIGPYGTFQDSGSEPTDLLQQCLDVAAIHAEQRRSTVLFEPDLGEARVHEHVLRLSDGAVARSVADRLRSTADACSPGDPAQVTTTDRGPESVGAGAFRWSRLSTPTADAGIGYYELAVSREGNVVVVLEWSSMGNPEGSDAGWVWTDGRVQAAVDRAVD